jgi:hypothetical protein
MYLRAHSRSNDVNSEDAMLSIRLINQIALTQILDVWGVGEHAGTVLGPSKLELL